MISDLYNILISTAKILSTAHIANKTQLLLTYARLRLKNRFFQWFRLNPQFETIFGLKVSFFKYSSFVYLFEEIFVRQTYYFTSATTKPRIFDCGSNIGLSVIYFKSIYPDSKILAFEPDPQTFKILQNNIHDNHISNVELVNQAIMGHEGVVDFYTDSETAGTLSMSTVAVRGGQNKQTIPCRPLSQFIDGPIEFLKMDIEGAESQCIEELQKSGRFGQVKEMIIECHHNMSEDKILSNILPTLDQLGYKYQISAQPQHAYQFKQDVMVHAVHQ